MFYIIQKENIVKCFLYQTRKFMHIVKLFNINKYKQYYYNYFIY